LQIGIIIPIITGSHRFQAAPDRTSALKVIQEAFRPGDGGPMDLMVLMDLRMGENLKK
jgi:hypothetical protein